MGDVVVAADGQPVHSLMEGGRIFFRHKGGERMTLTLQRGGGQPFDVSFITASREQGGWMDLAVPIVLNIVTPWFCIVLGFLVAFRRTGDPVAYALLALLLCVSQTLKAEAAPRMGWEALFSWPGVFLDLFPSRVLPAAWLWFAIVFPDPASRHRVWPWSRWAIAFPFVAYMLVDAIYGTVVFHQAHALAWLAPMEKLPSWIPMAWISAMIAIGFANFGNKLGHEKRPGMRRKLRWVLFGLALGVWPTLTLLCYSAVTGKDLNAVPSFLLFPVVLSPFFVPLTLAYAVLVDRVFNIGFFVRQGLLASKTVSALRIVLMALLIWTGVWFASQTRLGIVIRVLGAIGCGVAILLVRRGANRLREWVDRRFFQEAIDTEHLLIELSTEVRRIPNAEALLRTVTERLASALHVSRVVALIPNHTHFVPAYASGLPDATYDIALADPVVAEMREHRQPLLRADVLLLPLTAGDDLQGILSLGPKRSEGTVLRKRFAPAGIRGDSNRLGAGEQPADGRGGGASGPTGAVDQRIGDRPPGAGPAVSQTGSRGAGVGVGWSMSAGPDRGRGLLRFSKRAAWVDGASHRRYRREGRACGAADGGSAGFVAGLDAGRDLRRGRIDGEVEHPGVRCHAS